MAKLDHITKRVDYLVRRYGTRDPFELCRNLSIDVKYKQLGNSLKAFFFYQSRIKTIILNSTLDENLQTILCAHELGHAILHYKLLMTARLLQEQELFNSTDMTEYEANMFGAELLISDEQALEILESGEASLFQAASILYVPAELLDFKIRILKKKGYELEVPYIAQADFLKQI